MEQVLLVVLHFNVWRGHCVIGFGWGQATRRDKSTVVWRFRLSEQVLRSFSPKLVNPQLMQSADALSLIFRSEQLYFKITLASRVAEWYVEVRDEESGLAAEDWYGYAGYGRDSTGQIDGDLSNDLNAFLTSIKYRQLRFKAADIEKGKGVLEWQEAGEWHQVVPFIRKKR